MTETLVSIEDVRAAAERIAPFAHKTPVLTCETFNQWSDKSLFFKCENLQKVGAFKFRGACNAILQLNPHRVSSGVVTHSSGNHAQALALAARLIEVPAFIVMPYTAPEVKQEAVAGYGGQIFECDANLASREAVSAQVEQDTGAAFIPPYDHPDIIAGQGTAALELIEAVPDLDAIIAPVGGGGLISGVCSVARNLGKPIRVFAAEPKGADDAFRSKEAGELIPQTEPNTVADGLLTSLGELTWPYVRDHVERVITVGEKQIVEVMKDFWMRTKHVIEPSAAVAVAAALSDEFADLSGIRRVGVILSGGNVDLNRLPWLRSQNP